MSDAASTRESSATSSAGVVPGRVAGTAGEAPTANRPAPDSPANALSGAAVGVVQQPSGEPTPDERVSAAFVLGWQMAELYRPNRRRRTPPASEDDLPAVSHLDDDLRVEIALRQLDVALLRLGPPVTLAGVALPDPSPIRECLQGHEDAATRRKVVSSFHVELLSVLTAADFRLGKAYGLGRGLADLSRNPEREPELRIAFDAERVSNLRAWLDDLSSALPPHAGHSVGNSLDRWTAWVAAAPIGASHQLPAGTLELLRRQGELWRSLLSGEKCATDTLEVGNYLDAASQLLRTTRRLASRFAWRFPLMVVLIVALFAGGVTLMLNKGTSASIVAGAGSILASIGLTWKGIGASLGRFCARLEQHLWGAELDTAVADAITLLPDNKRERGNRKKLALQGAPVRDPTASTSDHPG